MGTTTQSQMIYAPLYAEAVEGAFASKEAFIGSLAAQLGIVKIDGSFPQAGNDKIGTTVKVPYFGSLGEYVARSDGTPASATTFGMTEETGTITCGTLGFELTTWAGATTVPGKSPYDEAARQVLAAAERRMDRLIIDEFADITTKSALVLDVYNATAPVSMSYDLIVNGMGKWSDRADLNEIAAVAVHGKVYNDLLKVKDGIGRPMLIDFTVINGVTVPVLKYLGKPLLVSDRLPCDGGSTLTAVTSYKTTGTNPVITIAASANREGGTGPVRPVDVVIQATTPGTLTNWKFRVSIDGGQTFGVVDQYTSAATVALIDPYDPAGGLLGITLSIAAGTAVGTSPTVDHFWKFQTTAKHTSLILKKGAGAFWYNAKYAGVLQQVVVPLNDSTINASHLYGVAHKYRRLPGQPLGGVVVMRHNGSSL